MDSNLRRALANLTTGIYVLTVADGQLHHGMSSSWVTQVSGEPVLIMAAVDNAHFSRGVIERDGAFGLNIVGVRHRAIEDYFLSAEARRPDNLSGLAYSLSPMLGVPWLVDATASIEARVVNVFTAGDHALITAEPVGVRIGDDDRPLTSLDLDYVYLGGKTVFRRERAGTA
jgi:flavin reductase (DIM6/NTAB) family NADH-FMN oxidoreductase RutF